MLKISAREKNCESTGEERPEGTMGNRIAQDINSRGGILKILLLKRLGCFLEASAQFSLCMYVHVI